MKKWLIGAGIFVAFLAMVFGTSYNSLVTKDETVSESWGQVQATYQRRLDLIPNLVATVKGYAQHESATLLAVTNARTKAYEGLKDQNAPSNPAALKKIAESQAALSSALNGLMIVVERYPDLKASSNFLALQTQLEGTENRITVARERFNSAVQSYNAALRRFPGNVVASIMGGFTPKVYFQSDEKAAQAPTVSF